VRTAIRENPLAALIIAALGVTIAALIAALVVQSRRDAESSAAQNTVNQTVNESSVPAFDYSSGIGADGFWEGITASDYVTNFDFLPLTIPASAHVVTEEQMQSTLQSFLSYFGNATTQVTDRAVVAGDQVNIDYVGSVDGVAFDGGSTNGGGTTVTAGGTGYIDDFLDQIIGRMPGETFDVLVTFPEEYSNNPDLAGKDAVFETTINYIAEPVTLTDEFVAENFAESFGWHTVVEMETAQRAELEQAAIDNYINEFLRNNVEVSNIPPAILEYQQQSMIQYFQDYAADSGMTLTEFLQSSVGVNDTDQLMEMYQDTLQSNSRFSLVIQAIAEHLGITVTQDDLTTLMPEYAEYEEEYGLPFVMQYVLELKVLAQLRETAQLTD